VRLGQSTGVALQIHNYQLQTGINVNTQALQAFSKWQLEDGDAVPRFLTDCTLPQCGTAALESPTQSTAHHKLDMEKLKLKLTVQPVAAV